MHQIELSNAQRERFMHRIELTDQEITAIQSLLKALTAQYTSVEDAHFIRDASLYAHELPRKVRAFLSDFKMLEPSGVCVIAGYPIDDTKIGKTPEHWQSGRAVSRTLEEELLFVLFGSLLGDIFGWSTQQGGYLVHDILPIRGHENEQMGSSSEQVLWWHTEEAFHPYRCDYLGLMCLRNPDLVGTTVVSIDGIEIPPEHARILFEPRFSIRPDDSHFQKNKVDSEKLADTIDDLLDLAYNRIQQMNTCPDKISVLHGDPRSPYICIDPYYMDQLGDEEAQAALDAIVRSINANLSKVVLQPGDFCFIDNYRAVHGREAFKARFDGTDRWLKRINITRDLRKSRSARASIADRVIF